MTISDEKYVASTTYRKTGATVSTQTWICALDGSRIGFWTSSASGKYKRLRNNPSISLQACDSRGRAKPGSRSVKGTAELVTSGADFDAIQSRIRAKYGAMVPFTRFLNFLGNRGKSPYGDVGVVITVRLVKFKSSNPSSRTDRGDSGPARLPPSSRRDVGLGACCATSPTASTPGNSAASCPVPACRGMSG